MSEGSLKVLLDFRRRVASIMREHDAVRVNVLRPALAVVGVLSSGTSTYPIRRSVIVQCSRGLRGGGCEGWSRLRRWPWGCGTRRGPYGTRAARLTLRDASAGAADLDTSCFQRPLMNI